MRGVFKGVRGRIGHRGILFRRALLRALPPGLVDRLADGALRFRLATQEALRQRAARRAPLVEPRRASFDGVQFLTRSVLEPQAPWLRSIPVPCNIPGMLTASERQYYAYITRFYSGFGEAVELGPWLGLSTFHLLHGLRSNPFFAGRRLHVYDDFTWRSSWMDKWLDGTGIVPPENHQSFLPLFRRMMEAHLGHLEVGRCKIADYDGNEALPPLEWNRGPIELLVVDCGRPLHVNEAWYRALSPFFMPERTLIVMQDWQNHKRVPEMFWENTKIFTDGKQGALDLIHEVAEAGIATFLFRKGSSAS